MNTPYKLRLLSLHKPDDWPGIHCSNHMIGWGLWKCLSQLPHIDLSYFDTDPLHDNTENWKKKLEQQSEVDFTLLHSYTPGPVFDHINIIRSKTRKKIIWISEQIYSKQVVDYCFTFLPQGDEQIPLPCPKGLLIHSMTGVQKLPGSILLDHTYWNVSKSRDTLWIDKLYDWLKPLSSLRKIGQLAREGHEALVAKNTGISRPDWVTEIPETYYMEYLKNTGIYENYIMTHPESYGHSIIDMAARGIRVLVPVHNGEPFAAPSLIKDLRLPTFTTKEELYKCLATPLSEDWRLDVCTDMPEIVNKIDNYCQREISQ